MRSGLLTVCFQPKTTAPAAGSAAISAYRGQGSDGRYGAKSCRLLVVETKSRHSPLTQLLVRNNRVSVRIYSGHLRLELDQAVGLQVVVDRDELCGKRKLGLGQNGPDVIITLGKSRARNATDGSAGGRQLG